MWVSTVFWLRNSSAAICGLVLRSTISRAICSSRSVSASTPVRPPCRGRVRRCSGGGRAAAALARPRHDGATRRTLRTSAAARSSSAIAALRLAGGARARGPRASARQRASTGRAGLGRPAAAAGEPLGRLAGVAGARARHGGGPRGRPPRRGRRPSCPRALARAAAARARVLDAGRRASRQRVSSSKRVGSPAHRQVCRARSPAGVRAAAPRPPAAGVAVELRARWRARGREPTAGKPRSLAAKQRHGALVGGRAARWPRRPRRRRPAHRPWRFQPEALATCPDSTCRPRSAVSKHRRRPLGQPAARARGPCPPQKSTGGEPPAPRGAGGGQRSARPAPAGVLAAVRGRAAAAARRRRRRGRAHWRAARRRRARRRAPRPRRMPAHGSGSALQPQRPRDQRRAAGVQRARRSTRSIPCARGAWRCRAIAAPSRASPRSRSGRTRRPRAGS